MGKVSRVMYSIANFFNWLYLLIAVIGLTFSILSILNVLPEQFYFSQLTANTAIIFGAFFLYYIIVIALVRKAKLKGTSKFWDVLFILVGLIGGNIFYVLGGIFGLISYE